MTAWPHEEKLNCFVLLYKSYKVAERILQLMTFLPHYYNMFVLLLSGAIAILIIIYFFAFFL